MNHISHCILFHLYNIPIHRQWEFEQFYCIWCQEPGCAFFVTSNKVSIVCWAVSFLAPPSPLIACFLGPLLVTPPGNIPKWGSKKIVLRWSLVLKLFIGVNSGRQREKAALSRKGKLLFRPKTPHSTPRGALQHVLRSKLSSIWPESLELYTPASTCNWMWASLPPDHWEGYTTG